MESLKRNLDNIALFSKKSTAVILKHCKDTLEQIENIIENHFHKLVQMSYQIDYKLVEEIAETFIAMKILLINITKSSKSTRGSH